jgi:hypothetical protein
VLKDFSDSKYEKFSAAAIKLARDVLQIAQMSATNRYSRVFNHLNYQTYKKNFAELTSKLISIKNDMAREAFLKEFMEKFIKNIIE